MEKLSKKHYLVDSLKKLKKRVKEDKNHLLNHLILDKEITEQIKKKAQQLSKISNTLIHCGIGGSSLSAKVFESIKKRNRIIFLEGVDSDYLLKIYNEIDFLKTSLIIVSKSGTTLETLINSSFILKIIKEKNPKDWNRRILITTSNKKSLLFDFALKNKIEIFEIPPPVGGRFSFSSPAGLFPAIYMGLDEKEFIEGIKSGLKESFMESQNNRALEIALFYLNSLKKGNLNIILWGYGEKSYLLSQWLQQLFAESLGKINKKNKKCGLLPISLKGSEAQHSVLQYLIEGRTMASILFINDDKENGIKVEDTPFLKIKGNLKTSDIKNSLLSGTMASLKKHNFLTYNFSLKKGNLKEITKAMTIFIVATLIIADQLEIDPFTQDGVEEGKKMTLKLIT